jgi:hypothetical protein
LRGGDFHLPDSVLCECFHWRQSLRNALRFPLIDLTT